MAPRVLAASDINTALGFTPADVSAGVLKAAKVLAGYTDGGSIGIGGLNLTTTQVSNSQAYWPIDAVANGSSVTIFYCLTKSSGTVTMYLGDGTSASKSNTVTLTCDGTPRLALLTANAAGVVRLVTLNTGAIGNTLTGDIIALNGDYTAGGLQNDKMTTAMLAMVNMLGLAFSNASSQALAAAVASYSAIGVLKSAVVLSGYTDGGSSGIGALNLTTTTASNAQFYWPIDTVAIGKSITVFYCLSKSAGAPTIYLGDGTSTRISNQVTLTCDGTPRMAVLTATASGVARLVSLNTGAVGNTLTGMVAGLTGDYTAASLQSDKLTTSLLAVLNLLTLSASNSATLRQAISTNTEGLGAILGAITAPSGWSATTFGPGVGEFSVTAPNSTNCFFYWPVNAANAVTITVFYRLSKTSSATPTIWLADGASTNLTSGGAKNLTCDGTWRTQPLTSTGAATRLFIQLNAGAGQTGTLSGDVFAIVSDATAATTGVNGLYNMIVSFMHGVKTTLNSLLSSVAANSLAIAANTTNIAAITTGRVKKYSPISARNQVYWGVQIRTGADSVSRRLVNGYGIAEQLGIIIPTWYLGNSGGNLVQIPLPNDIRGKATFEPLGVGAAAPSPIYYRGSTDIWIKMAEYADGRNALAFELGGLQIASLGAFKVHLNFYPVDSSGNYLPNGYLPFGQQSANANGAANGDHYVVGATPITSDKTGVLGGETTYNQSPANLFDVIVIGRRKATKSVISIEDSIHAFAENLTGSSDNDGHVGWVGRLYGKNHIDLLRIAQPSRMLSEFVNITTGALPGVTELLNLMGESYVVELGVNDFGAGHTAATMLSQLNTFCTFLNTAGFAYGGVATVPASPTNSSNNWIDGPGQTKQNASARAEKLTYNTTLRTALPAYVNFVIDVASDMCDPTDVDLFVTDGIANDTTPDGTHPTGKVNATVANNRPDPKIGHRF
ncbi:hypothetical protein [Asticcacaulis solisilvae]|uniref:hypothetical protein n=1 Tax=Asticcacaulis solisilvae TaxID=1217274 RepID=UPI003FD87B06